MRLGANPRAERLLGRLPRITVYSAAEILLILLIAVQAARFVWILFTPLSPVGDWKAASTLQALPASANALGSFDPFFRLAEGSGPAVVTALNLKLYGVREDRATGRGSAIIALPDGTQRSFAVGEEIMPGVTLSEVGFDSVTINRGGTLEQIFLDQSQPAQAAGAPAPTAVAPPQPVPPPPPPQPTPSVATPPPPVQGSAPIQFQPRLTNGAVTGVMVAPGGDGGRLFRSAGFAAGDVIVSINGRRVTSMEQARAILGQSGSEAAVIVDRGGRAVPMRVRFNP